MKIEIEQSPYGDTGKTYEGMLGMINHFLLQLESFRPQWLNDPEHLAYIDRDIAGYKELLTTNEETVQAWMTLKRGGKPGRPASEDDHYIRWPDNLAIVEHMKASGAWPMSS